MMGREKKHSPQRRRDTGNWGEGKAKGKDVVNCGCGMERDCEWGCRGKWDARCGGVAIG